MMRSLMSWGCSISHSATLLCCKRRASRSTGHCFRLLVAIGRRGTVGIVELAGLVGRDYTTVSRQVATLDRLGLVTRRAGPKDGRQHKVTATPEGLAMIRALEAARERLLRPILATWSEQDWTAFVSFLRRFADDALALTNGTDEVPPS